MNTVLMLDVPIRETQACALKMAKDQAVATDRLIYLYLKDGWLNMKPDYPDKHGGEKIIAKCYPGGRTELFRSIPEF